MRVVELAIFLLVLQSTATAAAPENSLGNADTNSTPSLSMNGCSRLLTTKLNIFEAEAPVELTYSQVPSEIERAIRPMWEPSRLTDPAHHDPQKFIYIIRIGNDYDEYLNGIPVDPKKMALQGLQRPNYVSASLVGKRANGVGFFGHYGLGRNGTALILKIPASSIHVAIPKDTCRVAASDQSNPGLATLLRDESYYGMYTPDTMLEESIRTAQTRERPDHHYNEILFVGSKDVEIIGVAQFGNDFESAQQRARRMGGVPVVRIE